MTVSITLQFSDLAAAARALFVLNRENVSSDLPSSAGTFPNQIGDRGLFPSSAAAMAALTEIAHADRPDVGASVPEPAAPVLTPAVALATAVFGGAAAPAAPTVPAPPLAPPPQAQAPAAPTPPTVATVPTAAPGVERDSTGLVWDARIHASTKTKVASGAWTAKRGVDPLFKAQIEADLRGVAAPVAAPAAPPAPPAAPVFQAPVAPAAPPAPAPAAASTAPAGVGFAQYMANVGGAFTNRPVDAHNFMAAALAPHGLQHVGQLAGRPDLIPAVDAEFQRLLAA